MSKAEEKALEAYPDYVGYNDQYTLGYVRQAYAQGYEQAEEEIRKKLLKFFSDNITHGVERGSEKGLMINIPTYTDLINKCSDALGIELMPLLSKSKIK